MGKYNNQFESLLSELTHERFDKVKDEINSLYCAKNQDYNDGDCWSNFQESEKIDVPVTKGIIVRMTDKFSRVLSLIRKHYRNIAPAVKDEKLEDTLIDLAVYSLIAVLSLRREQDGK